MNWKEFYSDIQRDFLQFRFQPSIDLLVVIFSFFILVAGVYVIRSSFSLASVWIPISMFILNILLPIGYNNLVKNRPLSETGISKNHWKKNLVLSIILCSLILPNIIAHSLTFTEILPLLAFELTEGFTFVIFFQGWVQNRFERAFGAIPAIFIAAAFFTFWHVGTGEPLSLSYVQHFMGGLLFSTIFRITRNIFILWPFFVPAAALTFELDWGFRLPFEAIYWYIGVLAVMWLFIAIVHRRQKK
jgi:membrane protease YdiL (CAAX protease family)